MRIDVHSHYYPSELIDRLKRLGSTRSHISPSGGLTLDERLELLDEAAIDVQVLSIGLGQPYFADADKATEGARYVNDMYQNLAERYAGRFAVFGCLPLPHVGAALAETAYCLDELQMVGINLGCSIAGRALEDPVFEPLWADLNHRRAIVFLHPMGIGGPFIDAFGLEMMVGSRFEDTISTVRLVMSGLTSRFPDVRIIVPHLGGTIPYLWNRLDESAGRNYGIAPTERMRRLYYDSVNKTPAALRCFCETIGPERLMLGTDYPYVERSRFRECVSYIEEAGLPQEQVTDILDRNAQALLKLPARKS